MKKIIFIYGQDTISEVAKKEMNLIRMKYQNQISQQNIQIISNSDNENNFIDDLNTFPFLQFIENENKEEYIGYDIEEELYYEKFFVDFFKILKDKPFDSWTWNFSTEKWDSPVPKPNDDFNYFWFETSKQWGKIGSGDPNPDNTEAHKYMRDPNTNKWILKENK